MANNLAKLVASKLRQDGVDFCNLTTEQQTQLVLAYAESETKQFNRFATAYHTRQEVKDAVNSIVLHSLKNQGDPQ